MPIPTYFLFKGTDSRDFGIVVMNYPPASIPAEKASYIEIPGRSGSLTVLEGTDVYKNIQLAIDCYVEDLSQRDKIAAWLRGSGDLVLGNNPTRCYRARPANQIDMTKVVRNDETRTFSAIFSCQPFQYDADPDTLTFKNPFTLINESALAAEPIFEVRGSGSITLYVGEVSVSLTGMSGGVTIDCEAKVSYTSAGNNVSITLNDEAWPFLASGENRVTWSGNVENITIKPNWRWL